MHDTLITLSTKLCASFIGALVSFMSTPIIAAIEKAPPWFSEYGALGMMCGFLIYALKVLHSINQNLQRDWREDRKKAEQERLDDRDAFYQKLEGHFDAAMESRQELVDHCKAQTEALDELSRTIKNHTKGNL